MMKKRKYVRYNNVLAEIVKAAKRNNGVAVSSELPSRVRQSAVSEYGSWAEACAAAGVRCPSGENKKDDAAEREILADVSGGILIKRRAGSLCFDCGRSGAPISLRCSWDARLVLPKGAVYCEKYLKIGNDETILLPVVLYCPLYVDTKDAEFRERVREERLKLSDERIVDSARVLKTCVNLFEKL